jgi:hypothetical protein
MPIGTITINLRDGGLGVIFGLNLGLMVSMGICSAFSPTLGAGAPLIQTFSQSDDAVASLGQGPLTEDVAYKLNVAGGSVLTVPIAQDTAGVVTNDAGTVITTTGTFTPHATGTGTVAIKTSGGGTPYDNDDLMVEIVSLTTGTSAYVTSGNVAARVSLDAGETWGQRVVVPTTGVLALTKAGGAVSQDRGIVLQFSVSTTTFLAGDYHTAHCQAPQYSTTSLGYAWAALLASPEVWNLVHVCGWEQAGVAGTGVGSDALLAAARFSACDAAMVTAYANGRDARCIIDVPNALDASLVTTFANATNSSNRVTKCATTSKVTSFLTGAHRTCGNGTPYTARLSGISPSTSPGASRDQSGALVGPLSNVLSTDRDERVTPGLFDQGFQTVQSIVGYKGVFSDIGRTSATAGSDFTTIMNCRVIDVVVTGCRQAALHYQNANFRVDSQGHLDRATADSINAYVAGKIVAMAGTEFSAVVVSVYTQDNILSTNMLRFKVRVRPFGYAQDVVVDVGFENPALSLAA